MWMEEASIQEMSTINSYYAAYHAAAQQAAAAQAAQQAQQLCIPKRASIPVSLCKSNRFCSAPRPKQQLPYGSFSSGNVDG